MFLKGLQVFFLAFLKKEKKVISKCRVCQKISQNPAHANALFWIHLLDVWGVSTYLLTFLIVTVQDFHS